MTSTMTDRSDCLCAGIIVADQVCEPIAYWPPPGSLILTPRMAFTIGGCAANVAADMAKLGLRVGVSGCVGADLFGRAVAEMLSGAGVNCGGLQAVADLPTSGTFVINVQGEDRRFIHCIGANAAYDGTQVSDAELQRTRVLYVGGYGLLAGLTPERVSQLFQRARAAGVLTLLDVVLPRDGDFWSWVAPVLPWTDIFLPNTDEARQITGRADPREQAAAFRAGGCQSVIITCGGDGALLATPDGWWRSAAHNVPAVDATGTGDAFVSGYVYGWLRGGDPATCLRYGSALGASCVQSIGATTGVFTASELEDFVQRHPLPVERVAAL